MSSRSRGQRITAAMRMQFGRRLRELLEKNPGATIAEMMAGTGAPKDMCTFIRERVRNERAFEEARTAAPLLEAGHA